MKLVECRNAGMANCTYFWVDDKKHQHGPFFDSQRDAEIWLEKQVIDHIKHEPVNE
jgi:hypothetical protein